MKGNQNGLKNWLKDSRIYSIILFKLSYVKTILREKCIFGEN